MLARGYFGQVLLYYWEKRRARARKMNFGESWGMLTGKIPKSQEYHEMTAKNQAQQVASQHDDPGGNIYNSFYQNAYNNSLANNTPNVAAQNNGSGDRPRSSFRNPQAGGLLSFFGGGSRLGDQPMTPQRFLENAMIPGLGIFRGLNRAIGSQPYTMNTQSGTGPGMTAAQISAKYGVSPRVAAATMQAAPAAQTGAATPPVAVEPLLGYGFEEDKFGFDPQAPRATLDDLDINLNPGYSQIADGEYVPSYDPFAQPEALKFPASQFGEVVLDANAPAEAALDFDAWLSSDQGQAMANKGLPEKNLRSMYNIYLKLNAGKF